jgi:hypothetical protein
MSVRDQQISVLVTADEMEQIEENAAFFAMSVSEFVRYVALGGTIDWRDGALRKRAWVRRLGEVRK